MGRVRKILTIFGTRPEAIKLFPILHALEGDARFNSRICVTGQHRGLLDQVLEFASIRPHHDCDVMTDDQSLDELTATLLTRIGQVLDEEKPDFVIVQGDTTTAMVAALVAHYRKIAIVHVEAGLRSGNLAHPWPEEANRSIISRLATLHCCPTQRAVDTLRSENVPDKTIHLTGNTVIDALYWTQDRLAGRGGSSDALSEELERFAGRRLIGVTCHRRESFEEGIVRVVEAVGQLARRPDVGILFPVHPNPNVRGIVRERLSPCENVALLEPLDYPDFCRLLDTCDLMLSDSGGVQEEAPALGTPVLVLRETTERPEAIEAGGAILVGTHTQRIVAETNRMLDDRSAYAALARPVSPFGDGRAAQRIVELLATA